MPFILLDPSTAAAAPASSAGAPLSNVGETLGSFRADLLSELGNRAGADVATSKLDKWINKAYEYVASILTIKELFASLQISLVAGQPLYLLPANVAWLRKLSVVDDFNYAEGGRQLLNIDAAMYRSLPVSSDEPTNYFREGRMLVLWPTPKEARTLVVDFRVRVQDLTLETHSPILPPEFHDSILLRAKQVAMRALKDYQGSAVARSDFIADIKPLQDTDANEAGEEYRTLRPIRSKRDLYRS